MLSSTLRYTGSGALAGGISALVFAGVHAWFISDIWFSALAMAIAGATCGGSIAWTYALLVRNRSVGSWVRYNLVYLVMLVLLGVTSVIVFEPVTTIAELLRAQEPPKQLFGTAMPMTVVFLLVMTVALGGMYGRNWRQLGPILVTCTVLVTLLGLNVSVIGLVVVPRGSMHLIAELFGLIAVLDVVYLATFAVLERRNLGTTSRPGVAA